MIQGDRLLTLLLAYQLSIMLYRSLHVIYQFTTKLATKLELQGSFCSTSANCLRFYQLIFDVEAVYDNLDPFRCLDGHWIFGLWPVWLEKLFGRV